MGKARIILRPTSFLRKQTGQMYKLFNLWERQKNPSRWERDFYKQPTAPPIAKEGKPVFLTTVHGLNTKFVTRRQVVLNRHFTEIISDLLVSSFKKDLDELGAIITSIESKAWNKGVNVFYYTDKPFDETTHKRLNSLSGCVASAITERRLIGRTPPINFVYDEVALIEKSLESSLKLANIKQVETGSEIVEETQSKKVMKSQSSSEESALNVKKFSAPPDMVNMALGLDYADIYNKVAEKLERGRGQSDRMPSGRSIASMGPMLRLPNESTTEEDPADRIKAMQKFIINQRKKREHLARVRRKQELLYRDSIKWDLPDDDSTDNPADKGFEIDKDNYV